MHRKWRKRLNRGILKQFSCHIKMESRLFIFNDRRVNLLSLCKFNISKMQNCSYNFKNCHLNRKTYYKSNECNSKHKLLRTFGKTDLLFLTDSNYIHSPSGCKIFMGIIYSIQRITVGLIQVMEWFRVPQLILLSVL